MESYFVPSDGKPAAFSGILRAPGFVSTAENPNSRADLALSLGFSAEILARSSGESPEKVFLIPCKTGHFRG